MSDSAARHRETPLPTPSGVVKRLFNTTVERGQNNDAERATLSAAFHAGKADELRKGLWQHIYDVDVFSRQVVELDANGRKRKVWEDFVPTIRERTEALRCLPSHHVYGRLIGFYAEMMKRGHVLVELPVKKIAKHTGISIPVINRAQRWLRSAGILSVHARIGIVQDAEGVHHAWNKSSLRALTAHAVKSLRLEFVMKCAQAKFERGKVTVAQHLHGNVHLWQKDFTAPRDPLQEPEDPVKLAKNAIEAVCSVAGLMQVEDGRKRESTEQDRVRFSNRLRGGCPCDGQHDELLAAMIEGDREAARTLVRHHKVVREKLTREQVAAILAADPPTAAETPF